MATHIHVFCRSAAGISYHDLADQMGFMGFLDATPTFDRPLDSPEAKRTDWKFLTLRYDPAKRPVQVEHWTEPSELRPVIEEIFEQMKAAGVWERCQEVAKRLDATKHAFHFELGDGLPPDVWEMLDATEGYLAHLLDGVVHSDEGFYDQKLQPLCLLRAGG